MTISMGILDRLFGRRSRSADSPSYDSPSWGAPAPQQPPEQPPGPYANDEQPSPEQSTRDAEAIRRYRYLLRTAPPEAIEQAHAEAFEQLSPDQRRARDREQIGVISIRHLLEHAGREEPGQAPPLFDRDERVEGAVHQLGGLIGDRLGHRSLPRWSGYSTHYT